VVSKERKNLENNRSYNIKSFHMKKKKLKKFKIIRKKARLKVIIMMKWILVHITKILHDTTTTLNSSRTSLPITNTDKQQMICKKSIYPNLKKMRLSQMPGQINSEMKQRHLHMIY
jgi:hypothetical protein